MLFSTLIYAISLVRNVNWIATDIDLEENPSIIKKKKVKKNISWSDEHGGRLTHEKEIKQFSGESSQERPRPSIDRTDFVDMYSEQRRIESGNKVSRLDLNDTSPESPPWGWFVSLSPTTEMYPSKPRAQKQKPVGNLISPSIDLYPADTLKKTHDSQLQFQDMNTFNTQH